VGPAFNTSLVVVIIMTKKIQNAPNLYKKIAAVCITQKSIEFRMEMFRLRFINLDA